MANANGAGIEIIGDNNEAGTTFGRDAAQTVGLHGSVSAQHNTTSGAGNVNSGTGAPVLVETQFAGNTATGNGYYTIGDIVTALTEKGILSPNGGGTAS